MTPLIFIALAALIGLPPHAARLAPASATETTAKTPRDGPTARGGLISKRLDASRRHQQSTAASLQGPQATATVLACLPIAGIAMGGAMGANSLGFLLGGGLGGILLVVGVALACGGFAWSRVIIRKAAA